MISRLTASALVFAVFATAGLAMASDAKHEQAIARASAAAAMPTIVLPRVEVTGRRPPSR
jgi:hypothetical protein